MKVLFVVEQGNAPSIRLRLLDCLDAYRAAGIQPTVFTTRSNLMNRLQVIRAAARHDAVVIFKAIGFTKLQLGMLQRSNSNLIVDFDDAVMFREEKYSRPLRARTFAKFLRTIERCSAVVAGNDFLRAFAEGNGRLVVTLPTPVDVAHYRRKEHRAGPEVVIGWLGLSDGFRYLQHIESALQTLMTRYPTLRLKVVSDRPLELTGVSVENESWSLEGEQAALASFDIGIMPLRDSVWARGKCSYKILQYMAAGLPVVASPVGMNRDVIESGANGFLAATEADWIGCLSRLIDDVEMRSSFGARGRELVERSYSRESFTRTYVDLLQSFRPRENA